MWRRERGTLAGTLEAKCAIHLRKIWLLMKDFGVVMVDAPSTAQSFRIILGMSIPGTMKRGGTARCHDGKE